MIDPSATPPLKYQMCYSVLCKLSSLYHNFDLFTYKSYSYLFLPFEQCGNLRFFAI